MRAIGRKILHLRHSFRMVACMIATYIKKFKENQTPPANRTTSTNQIKTLQIDDNSTFHRLLHEYFVVFSTKSIDYFLTMTRYTNFE